jgi:RNA polymerase sigma factor (sigma-70 family)
VPLDHVLDIASARPVSRDASLEREFEARVLDSSGVAFRVALGVLRRREEAEDVAQEAFLRAHRAFATLRDRERFRSWLVRVAFRLALDRQRDERRRRRREDRVAADADGVCESVEVTLAQAELREKVGEAVDALPEKLRKEALLRFAAELQGRVVTPDSVLVAESSAPLNQPRALYRVEIEMLTLDSSAGSGL